MNELQPDEAEETVGRRKDDAVPTHGYRMLPTVGLGGSGGSIPAIRAFLGAVPADSGMAFIVVIHLSPEHDSELAALLQSATPMPVTQVEQAEEVKPDHVYVVPPGHALRMDEHRLMLDPVVHERGRHVAVDLFFRTLAEWYGPHAVGVVLSGSDSDGSIGIKRIKERGGLTIVQDPEEAEVPSMPRAAIATNMIDWVLPVADMVPRLIEYRKFDGRLELPPEDDPEGEVPAAAADAASEAALRDVLLYLGTRTGRDFSCYKRATIVRRIGRRMQVNGVRDLWAYLRTLRSLPGEAGGLLQDLLISVTNFFRDSECFAALEARIPLLFEGKGEGDRVRVWVAGCASGEEAYSIAMLLQEHARTLDAPPLIQVFATDLDAIAIQTARNGFYPASIEADVTPERLRRFFVREHSGYRVRREIRESVLFAVHDVLKDSPFSRLDLVGCRNLLIYLTREAQMRALRTFGFALRPGGLLFLGSSETIDERTELFRAVDKKRRIYVRHATATPAMPMPEGPSTAALRVQGLSALPKGVAPHPAAPAAPAELTSRVTSAPLPAPERRAEPWPAFHFALLERIGPPSIIVDRNYDIVHLSPHAGQYLQLSGGEPTNALLQLVRPELRAELRAALFRASHTGVVEQVPPVSIELDGEERRVALRIVPAPEGSNEFFLVTFDTVAEPVGAAAGKGNEAEVEREAVAAHLDREIERLNDHLRDAAEQYEASTEELKASNEELQAMNEELRSASEELETSREELQSINEELTTVNHELKSKVEELGSSKSDMLNLMHATALPIVFLDRELRITRFTPAAVPVFNLIPSDVGRPLTDLQTELDFPTLGADAQRVLDELVPVEREIGHRGGKWYSARLLPYRTTDNRIAGLVLTLVDVTEGRGTARALRGSEERLRLIVENAREYAIFSMDENRAITSWNTGAERLLGYSEAEVLGRCGDIIFTPEDVAAGAPEAESRIALQDGRAADDRFHVRKDGTRFWASGVQMPMRDELGKLLGFVKILRDQSEARHHQEALERSRAELLQAWHENEAARREAELQKEHLASLFTQAPAPICILRGPEHIVEFVNPAMAQLWGKPQEEVVGKPIFDSVPSVRNSVFKQLLDNVFATGVSHVGKEVPARMDVDGDGALEEVHLNFTYAPLRGADGRIDGVMTMAADVTDEVRAREQMSELHEMEQAASRAKDDFLAMLGHELRNPLAPLRTSLHLIRQRSGERPLDPLFDIVERQAGNLSRIVDDLLEAARVSEGKIELRLERVDFAACVTRALEAAHEFLDSQRHQVSVNLPRRPLAIKADPVRIEQVVLNLLNNAGKYTPTGGRIDVSLKRVGRTAELRIIDTGIGISEDLRPRLFQIFQQGNRDLAREEGGLGIGLSVVRRLVDLHGGTVQALSEGPGQGSEFVVRLPLDTQALFEPPPAPTPLPPPADAAAPGRPQKVLVVDDNRDAGDTLVMLVESLGHEARVALDGPAALQLCSEWQPDLVFLDIGLPGMDGFEVAREIQQHNPARVPHLVAVTGYGQGRDREKTRDAGFDDHLVKPADFRKIVAMLERLPAKS